MQVYWKRFDKVEKEHRRKAEREALEQRKIDVEFREVRWKRHFRDKLLYLNESKLSSLNVRRQDVYNCNLKCTYGS